MNPGWGRENRGSVCVRILVWIGWEGACLQGATRRVKILHTDSLASFVLFPFFVCLFRCPFHALTSFSRPFYLSPSYPHLPLPHCRPRQSQMIILAFNKLVNRNFNGHCKTLDVRQSWYVKWCTARCIHVHNIWFVFCVCETVGRQWKREGESPGNLVIKHFDRLGLRVCHLWGFVACPLPIFTHIILTHDKW